MLLPPVLGTGSREDDNDPSYLHTLSVSFTAMPELESHQPDNVQNCNLILNSGFFSSAFLATGCGNEEVAGSKHSCGDKIGVRMR